VQAADRSTRPGQERTDETAGDQRADRQHEGPAGRTRAGVEEEIRRRPSPDGKARRRSRTGRQRMPTFHFRTRILAYATVTMVT